MEVKYQIFIRSTFRDLEEPRRVVIEQILNLQHIPVGMEIFQASDKTQWDYIKERILECDYYIVIIAERYGSCDSDGISFTQKEYEFAIDNGIPVAAFMLHDEARNSWPQQHVEFESRDKINYFRELCSRRMSKFWKNTDDLGLRVTQAIVEITRRHPRTGWIKANQATSGAVANEIARLLEENREMRLELNLLSERKSNDRDAFELSSILCEMKLINDLHFRTYSNNGQNIVEPIGPGSTMNIYNFILEKGPRLASGLSIYEFTNVVSELFDNREAIDLSMLIDELAALDIIEIQYIPENIFDRIEHKQKYLLSTNGKAVLRFGRSSNTSLETLTKGDTISE